MPDQLTLQDFLSTRSLEKAVHALEECTCKTCGGLGECNDADDGDMYFKVWPCQNCDGTGWNPKAVEKLTA